MLMNLDGKRIDAARRLVQHVAEHLEADLSVRLWNGEIVPLKPGAKSDILLCINSAAALRRLILAPKLMTLAELYASGDVDIEGGTPIETARRWDHMRALRLARSLDKSLVLKSVWPFLVGSGSAGTTHAASFDRSIEDKLERGRDDKELIQFHYDVSNAFYALFLDPEMVYSSAYFARPDMTLEEAQGAKLDMICRRLRLQPGDRFLDIGCGWGGLICHAARNYGVTAYGVTLSQAQLEWNHAKIKRLGLEDKVTVELRDYRTIDRPEGFDKIAQIEMFEHVGMDNHDAHFQLMHKLLRVRGLYLHQASTRILRTDPKRFRAKTPYMDVITRFIFPGGELDYIGLTATNLERHGFEVHDVEAWREHFHRTLEMWIERLGRNREAAEKEVGRARTRLWLLYLSISAMGFERAVLGVFQTLASKRRRGASGVPFSRADLYA